MQCSFCIKSGFLCSLLLAAFDAYSISEPHEASSTPTWHIKYQKMGYTISASILIDTPPASVRAVLLDFSSYHEWNSMIANAEVQKDDPQLVNSTSSDGTVLHFRITTNDASQLKMESLDGLGGTLDYSFKSRGSGCILEYKMTFRCYLILRPLLGIFASELKNGAKVHVADIERRVRTNPSPPPPYRK